MLGHLGPQPAPPPPYPLQGTKMFKGCRGQGLHLGAHYGVIAFVLLCTRPKIQLLLAQAEASGLSVRMKCMKGTTTLEEPSWIY